MEAEMLGKEKELASTEKLLEVLLMLYGLLWNRKISFFFFLLYPGKTSGNAGSTGFVGGWTRVADQSRETREFDIQWSWRSAPTSWASPGQAHIFTGQGEKEESRSSSWSCQTESNLFPLICSTRYCSLKCMFYCLGAEPDGLFSVRRKQFRTYPKQWTNGKSA